MYVELGWVIIELLPSGGLSWGGGGERAEVQTLTKKRDIVSVVSALSSLAASSRIDRPGIVRAWESLDHPSSTRYRELKNQATAYRQKVLEESSYKQKLKCLVAALKFDVSCRMEDF